MVLTVGLDSSPKNTLNKLLNGIVTEPMNKLRINNIIPKIIIEIKMLIFILLRDII